MPSEIHKSLNESFVKIREFEGVFELAFSAEDLRECPSDQLQISEKFLPKETENLSAKKYDCVQS